MANPWFRMYSEFSHDPKVQMMSEAMQRRYMMLMCLHCSNSLVTLHETEIAFHLRISEADMAETKALFISKGFIDESFNLMNWDKRQFSSDTSAARVAKHRALQKEKQAPVRNGDVTLQKQNGNALDTEQSRVDTENTSLVDFADEQDDFGCLEEILLPTNDAERSLQQYAILVPPAKPKQESVACPQDALLDLYEARLPDLPQPRKSLWKDGKNAPALKARWDWVMTARHESGSRKGERMAITQEDGLNWFDRFFGYVAKSDYLTGQKNDFSANLIWLVKKENFEKVISGNYEKKEKAA